MVLLVSTVFGWQAFARAIDEAVGVHRFLLATQVILEKFLLGYPGPSFEP